MVEMRMEELSLLMIFQFKNGMIILSLEIYYSMNQDLS